MTDFELLNVKSDIYYIRSMRTDAVVDVATRRKYAIQKAMTYYFSTHIRTYITDIRGNVVWELDATV